MIGFWKDDRGFKAFWIFYVLVLLALILSTPLTPNEAKLFYGLKSTPEIWVARWIHAWIPGVLGLRLWPFFLGMGNLYLFYRLLEGYFDRESDRRLTTLLFAILPGVVASTVLLNDAVFALFLTLLFLVAYREGRVGWQVASLLLLLTTDTAVFALYLAVALYAWKKRQLPLAIFALSLMVLALAFGLFDFGGKPRGHLPELFGIDAALFSPLFFIYYFYALYRTALEGPRDLVWTISFTALLLSILLSIRQQVLIVDFSPYLLVGTMIPVAVYLRSLRVRMRRFQGRYRLGAALVTAVLILSTLALVLHRPLYHLLGEPERFSVAALYRYEAMARELRHEGRNCYRDVKKRYEPLMRFYGFHPCGREERPPRP